LGGSFNAGLSPADQSDLEPGLTLEAWLDRLASAGELGALFGPSWSEQLARGYGHTLREISQQPITWLETATRVVGRLPLLQAVLQDAGVGTSQGALVLTGSGSSVYAGECLAPALQPALGMSVSAVPAGHILTHPEASLPPHGPFAVVSLARSGNSPESCAVVDSLLSEPRACHLVITCNGQGTLATGYGSHPRVRTVVLDDKTNDQSLVMSSSFTNMVLAGALLGSAREPEAYAARARQAARGAAHVLKTSADALAGVARRPYASAVYLGSGCRLGAAHESSLKMLEMNDGRVWTLPESYLGLRHGPMSALRADSLVVAFLSSDPLVRAYEADLIRELDRKKLGARRVIVGASVPTELASGPEDVVVDLAPTGVTADEDLVLIDVVVGQLLAFFRCLQEGLRPDSPSEGGVISRVVSRFEIHRRPS
jgi:fructoselysine-6-P-deglycase FrlB-like protein